MKILLITQYFFPETGATSNRIYSLAKHFKKQGHQVHVIAERPNHPAGVFFEGYEKGAFIEKIYKDIPVTYTWVFTRPKKGFIGRILFYLSFMFMAVVAALRLVNDYDIICASSPPLFVGIAGWAAAKIHKGKFVFDVRDLWPDVAVKMGQLNNQLAISLAEKTEHFLYKKADLITTVTHSFKQAIREKGVKKTKIDIVTNGTASEVFHLKSAKEELRISLNLDTCFLVSYVGNIGLAQGLGHIIDSALRLENKGVDDIKFLIVGDGPEKKHLKEKAASVNIHNITFVNRVPLAQASRYMNASDALLVPLADDPIYSQFVPSKLFDGMAAARPILLSVDGEAREILTDSKGGLYYEAENAKQLTQKILWLKANPKKALKMGKKGREFVNKHYTREVQAECMLYSFDSLVD
jgi:glycosyltransferase involved in cell wall biosynthesis